MIDMIIFDWNGTLLDDAQATWQAANEVLKYFNRSPIDFELYKNSITVPTRNFYLKMGCTEKQLKESSTESVRIFHSHYEKISATALLRDGAIEALSWLKSKNIPCLILSNHLEESISAHIQRLNISQYFEAIIANTNKRTSRYRRSKDDSLQKFLAERMGPINKLLFIGDSPEEAELARRFNGRSILIKGGAYSDDRLVEAMADWTISTLKKLPQLIHACP